MSQRVVMVAELLNPRLVFSLLYAFSSVSRSPRLLQYHLKDDF
ncbi:MAG: hypothetical protein WA445_17665 [Pseudolabrys sp.]